MRNQSRHDGTHVFTMELLTNAFRELFYRNRYCTLLGVPTETEELSYLVGPIKLISIYQRVQVPTGWINGERQRVVVPVFDLRWGPPK